MSTATPWHLATSLYSAAPAIWPSVSCFPRCTCATGTANCPPTPASSPSPALGSMNPATATKCAAELGRFVAADALDDADR